MRIVVIGAGKVGKKIAERLLDENHDITVVDNDPVRLNALIGTHDIMSVQGNGAIYDVQIEAGVGKADVVIAATPDDEVNML